MMSVCLSLSPAAAAGLLLWVRRVGDIDRLMHGAQQQMRVVARLRQDLRVFLHCFFGLILHHPSKEA